MTMHEKDSLVSPELLAAYDDLSQASGLLPVKVSPFYRSLVQEEVETIGVGGPLYRNVYPTEERLTVRAPFEVPDFVTDKDNMGENADNTYIQKYANRILMLSTERCFANCMYCFRTQLLADEAKHTLPDLEEKTETVAKAIEGDTDIQEVIFSGGDPLVIPHKALRKVFATLRARRNDINLRVHTRAIAFAPQVIDEEMGELLGEYDVRTYFHLTHPYEVTEPQCAAFDNLRRNNVRMYNQTPIIRGVNDHAAVLGKLVIGLESEHVRPTSFFIADPINYSADFRVPLRNLFDIHDELRWKLPSWAANFRIVLDSPVGKVRREDITAWDSSTDTVTFTREDKDVVYHDLPQAQYIPGDISKMLWKDAK